MPSGNLGPLIIIKNIAKTLVATMYSVNSIILLAFLASGGNVLADKVQTIAITEIVEHPSLAEAKKGIIDELADNGLINGQNIRIIERTAQGSIANSMLIAKQFVALKPDVVVAISTPSTQSVIKAISGSNIAVVFSSVSDIEALGIKDSKINIGGAVDLPPVKEQVELIKHILPNARKIGLLYNAGEANSVNTIRLLKNSMEGRFEFIESQIAGSNQIVQAISALAGKVDLIYIPSDNTVFSALPKLVQISRKYKIPVFSGDPDSVKQGVLACIGYSQYQVGKTAGKVLVKYLKEAGELSIEKPARAEIYVNKATADIMSLDIEKEIMGIKVNFVDK